MAGVWGKVDTNLQLIEELDGSGAYDFALASSEIEHRLPVAASNRVLLELAASLVSAGFAVVELDLRHEAGDDVPETIKQSVLPELRESIDQGEIESGLLFLGGSRGLYLASITLALEGRRFRCDIGGGVIVRPGATQGIRERALASILKGYRTAFGHQ